MASFALPRRSTHLNEGISSALVLLAITAAGVGPQGRNHALMSGFRLHAPLTLIAARALV